MLTEEQQAEILSLHYSEGMAIRAIARQLGVDRKSVNRIVQRRSIRTEHRRDKTSLLSPYREYIREQVCNGVPASTILSHLRERGYLGGRTILQEYVAELRGVPARRREAFLEIEFLSGECAQVDWGEFGNVFGDGSLVHCFVMVLCYSRLMYIEFTRGEKYEDFVRCHENAFKYFGDKVPRECWYDNLASAVTERLNKLVKFNSRFRAYLGHHGIRPFACNPASGNEKGRVEDGVKYIRSAFWSGRSFISFEDICHQARKWVDDVANRREHRSTRKVPVLLFENEEKNKLLPMNPTPYDTDEIFSCSVSSQCRIKYETNRYSVPWTMAGSGVTVRVTDKNLIVYYHDKKIAEHDRCYGKYQAITKDSHYAGLRERKSGDDFDSWRLSCLRGVGEHVSKYLEFIHAGNRSIRGEVAKLLALSTIYGHEALNNACRELLSRSVIRTANLELFLQNNNTKIAPEPIAFKRETLNRAITTIDLRSYDDLIIETNTKGGTD